MSDKLNKIVANRNRFSVEEQTIIDGWVQTEQEIAQIADVKNMPAWTNLQSKIQDELRKLIIDAVTNDPKAYALSQVLTAMNTKTQKENLEAMIESVILNF